MRVWSRTLSGRLCSVSSSFSENMAEEDNQSLHNKNNENIRVRTLRDHMNPTRTMSYPRGEARRSSIDFGVFVCFCKRESPPSIMVTRNLDWSFRDSKVRDWLRTLLRLVRKPILKVGEQGTN